MALKVAPSVSEWMAGIPVTLDQLEAALYTLAAAVGEEDWDGVEKLIVKAKNDLTTGRDEMPSLVSSLISKGATGSYVAGRDALNAAFRQSGAVVRFFEHNSATGRQSEIFRHLTLEAYPVAPDLYLLTILDRKAHSQPSDWLEATVAEAMGIERALKSIAVSCPIEVVNRTRFRFDIEPIIDALHQLGIGPIQYADSRDMTGEAAATYFMAFLGRSESTTIVPNLYFVSPKTLGLEVILGAYGCDLGGYDQWEHTRTVHCQCNGTVFTGPISADYLDATRLQQPTMELTIRRPTTVRDGDPAWAEMATPEVKAPARQLAADLVRILTK